MNNRKSKPPLPDTWAIEQDFVARWPDGREQRFALRIGLPELGLDNQGQPSWNAVMLLDGLLDGQTGGLAQPTPIRDALTGDVLRT